MSGADIEVDPGTEAVLFVDDEINILKAYKRGLRRRFAVSLATGGPDALRMMEGGETFAVIVADMRMPDMTGVELLSRVKELAPDTVRMMLTGNADQQTAIDAINHGDIFRFLNKPCPAEDLESALEAAIGQHRLITAERELLDKTLTGSIKMLMDMLAMMKPDAFGHTDRLQRCMEALAREMQLPEMWRWRTLALLSQIGCVILSDDMSSKLTSGGGISAAEAQLFEQHPLLCADLVANIPRMETVADAIRYQLKGYDGSGVPRDSVRGEGIPLGARMLRCVLDYDQYENAGMSPRRALGRMQEQAHVYDPGILKAMWKAFDGQGLLDVIRVSLAELEDGMIIAEDLRGADGSLVACRGQGTTATVRERLARLPADGSEDLLIPVLAVARFKPLRAAAPSA